MQLKDRNGVRQLGRNYESEMKQGYITGQCVPLETSTFYPRLKEKSDVPRNYRNQS